MSYPVYYVPAGDVLPVLFDSFDGGTGGAITMTWLAVTDIEIYKDGSITQRASDAGYTLLDTDGIDFDGITGIHGFSIDTGDNTDAGFYSVGAWYHVVVSAVTIDAQTVNFVACAFRIMAAEGVAGVPDVNTTHISDTAQTANDVVQDVNDILTDTGTTLDTKIDTIDNFLDTEIAAILASVDTEVAAILADTGTDGVIVATNNDKTGYALSATGSAALTEGYAADGAAPTLNQMLYMILQTLMEFSISGTTLTVKKIDGSTTAMTVTLDDGTNPTSRTRAT